MMMAGQAYRDRSVPRRDWIGVTVETPWFVACASVRKPISGSGWIPSLHRIRPWGWLLIWRFGLLRLAAW